ARLDSGGALQVGPQSAGSDPGPICYGKGEQLTVTDANLFLGRLIPDHFLGGDMRLHPDKISAPFGRMAAQTRLSAIQAAEGIVQVINAAMERAIRVVSVEKGFDPAEFTLFAFGGAGGLHAVFLARLLNIPRVLVPVNPGILSAVGMLLADVVKDYSQTVMTSGSCDPQRLEEMFIPLETEAVEDLRAEGVQRNRISLKRYLDMRYEGQSYEILVPAQGDDPVAAFHELHRRAYGYCSVQKNTEIVNIRLRAVGASEKPVLKKSELSKEPLREACFLGNRPVVFEGRFISTPIISRQGLCPGNRIQGPAVLVEYSSTIILPPGAAGQVDAFGNLLIETRTG
ncbi:MAG: hydantoinase/oxoprolinase family protein, partial [Desulfobacterales bacterium]